MLLRLATIAAAAAAGAAEPAAQGPNGPPIKSYLKIANASAAAPCARFSLNATDAMIRLESSSSSSSSGGGGGGGGGSSSSSSGSGGSACLTYGGYSEANTGLAECLGWSAPGVGAQLWTVLGSGGSPRKLQVKGEAKQLAVIDCGKDIELGVEVCSPDGSDCGPKGGGCVSAFEWTLRPTSTGHSFELVSDLKGRAEGLCAVVTTHKPPAPTHPKPVGPMSGGGGAWSVTCNKTASCPVQQTCCTLNSSNWGCCPGPNAVCCPGGVTCCPNGYTCAANGRDAYNGATTYKCKSGGALDDLSTAGDTLIAEQQQPEHPVHEAGRRKLPNWPPQLTSSPPEPRPKLSFTPALHATEGSPRGVLTARSVDGQAAVSIDSTTGDIVAVESGEHSFATRALSTLLPLLNSTDWAIAATSVDGGGVRVERVLPGKVISIKPTQHIFLLW